MVAAHRDTRAYGRFLFSVSMAIAVCLSAVFVGLAFRTRHLHMEEVLMQARAHFNGIVLMRKWNAGYGGVYVEKRPGVVSNPYLDDPDVTTTDGRVFTLRNPAIMAREISEYSRQEGLFTFHMASLRPVNPQNEPDEFERKALEAFEEGRHEVYAIAQGGKGAVFRYMAPLRVERECLACHAREGYREGDLRGGITVEFDVSPVRDKLRANLWGIGFFGTFTIALLLGFTYFFSSRLMRQLVETHREVEEMAVTDSLTGLANRRYLVDRFEAELSRALRSGEALSCILLDIDHFKRINDTRGHLHGDGVLRRVAHVIRGALRTYDVAGRFGGEEFLLLLQGAGLEDCTHLAERIRLAVRQDPELSADGVTASLGAVSLRAEDRTVDDVLRRADEALYRAKSGGRDRVEAG
jgi:diguanylate cyclase (GGDEF)-like protein